MKVKKNNKIARTVALAAACTLFAGSTAFASIITNTGFFCKVSVACEETYSSAKATNKTKADRYMDVKMDLYDINGNLRATVKEGAINEKGITFATRITYRTEASGSLHMDESPTSQVVETVYVTGTR